MDNLLLNLIGLTSGVVVLKMTTIGYVTLIVLGLFIGFLLWQFLAVNLFDNLFTPAWKSWDNSKRENWIKKTADPDNPKHTEILYELAMKDSETVIQKHAIDKISNDNILADIVSNNDKKEVCEYAVNRISDKDILNDLLKGKNYYSVCKIAYKKLGIENTITALGNCALYDEKDGLEAVKKITDVDWLEYIIENSENLDVRIEAIGKIDDQNMLANIAKDDENYKIRLCALKRITDKNILSELAKESTYSDARIRYLEVIEDAGYLRDLALNDIDVDVRMAAIYKLSDEKILSEIAEKDPSFAVREYVYQKMGKSNSIEALCDRARNGYSGKDAIKQLAGYDNFIELISNKQLKTNELLKSLIAVLKENYENSKFNVHPHDGYSWLLKSKVATVLGNLGDPIAVGPLIETYQAIDNNYHEELQYRDTIIELDYENYFETKKVIEKALDNLGFDVNGMKKI